jgi:hypothetical protein
MKQSDITSWVAIKSRRTSAADLVTIKRCLNDVLDQISKLSTKPLDFLTKDQIYPLASGDYSKDLPADFVMLGEKKPIFSYGTTQYELDKKDADWFNANYPLMSVETNLTEPSFYMINQRKLVFAGKSNGTGSIIMPYAFVHPEVSADTDVIYYPNSFLKAIRWLTLAEMYDDFSNDAQLQKYLTMGMGELERLGIIESRNTGVPTITDYSDL